MQQQKSTEQSLISKDLLMSQEIDSMRDKSDSKVRTLEQEMEKLQSSERSERLSMLNKHIEHVDSLNEQVKKLNKDNSDLSQQCKQVQAECDRLLSLC